jgi:hypothetical protein
LADPIRPASWPIVPAAPQRTDARSAAQRAFFALASGAQTDEPEARPAARKPDLKIDIPTEPPQKILRPGSLVDIRV